MKYTFEESEDQLRLTVTLTGEQHIYKKTVNRNAASPESQSRGLLPELIKCAERNGETIEAEDGAARVEEPAQAPASEPQDG